MTDEPTNQLRSQLENLKRKADQQASAHAWLRDFYSFFHSTLSTISLVAGVFLLAIVMASPELISRTIGVPPEWYPWFTALLAGGSFSVVVIQLAWRLDVKATTHGHAVRHYTRVRYLASTALQRGSEISADQVAEIQREYLDDRDLPRIPEKRFLGLKRWHLMKVQVSKELDKNPHESLRAIRRRLELDSTKEEEGRE